MPFQYENYRSPYVQSIGELMKAPAEQQAQLAIQLASIDANRLQQSAAIRGRAIGNVGQAFAQIGSDIEQHKRDAPRLEMQQMQLGQARQDLADSQFLRQALSMPDPAQAVKYLDSLGTNGVGAKQKYVAYITDYQEKAKARHDDAMLPGAFALARDPTSAPNVIAEWRAKRLMPEETLTAFEQSIGGDPEQARKIAVQMLAATKEGREALGKVTMLRPGGQAVGELMGDVRGSVPAAVTPPTRWTSLLEATGGDAEAANKLMQVEREGTSQDKAKLVLIDGKWQEKQLDYLPGIGGPAKWFLDGKEIPSSQIKDKPAPSMVIYNQKEAAKDKTQQGLVRMLRANRISPIELSKRGDFNALMEAADAESLAETGQGFDATQSNLQYQASQRFYKGLNSDQATKFRADGVKVQSTIKELQTLGNQMAQGNVQLWNKARRSTAENLFSGTEQGVLARRYTVALKTLEEEFARMVTGGYAPTEAAFKLAHEQIKGDVSLPALTAQLDEVDRLIGFGLRAPSQLGVQLPGQSGIPEPKTDTTSGGGGADLYQQYLNRQKPGGR